MSSSSPIDTPQNGIQSSHSRAPSTMELEQGKNQRTAFKTLQLTPLRISFSDEELMLVAASFTIETLPAGTLLYKCGHPADFCGVVSKGTLLKNAIDRKGESSVVAERVEGDFFGEEILTKEKLRMFTMEAKTPVRILRLAISELQRLKELPQAPFLLSPSLDAISIDGSTVNILKGMDLFSGVTPIHIADYASMLHPRGLLPGEKIISEGGVGDTMYIVQSGELIATSGEGAEKIPLNTFRKGDCFGEISLMINIQRTSNVISSKPSIILELHLKDFDRFMQLDQRVSDNITAAMKAHLAQQFRKYQSNFFDALSDEIISKIGLVSQIEIYEEGDVLFKSGDVGDRFFMIIDGEVKVTTTTGIPPQNLCKGHYFGEVSILEDTNRLATVTALCRSVFMTIERKDFQQMFGGRDCEEPRAYFDLKLLMPKVVKPPSAEKKLPDLSHFNHLPKRASADLKSAPDFSHFSNAPKRSSMDSKKITTITFAKLPKGSSSEKNDPSPRFITTKSSDASLSARR